MREFTFYLVAGLIITRIFEISLLRIKFLKKHFYDDHKSFFGYRFHHSCYGAALIILGLTQNDITTKYSLPFFGFGLGIILMHTLTDKRFIFIEKAQKG